MSLLFISSLLAGILAGGLSGCSGAICGKLNLNTIAFAMAHAALAGSAIALSAGWDPLPLAMALALLTALILGPLADHFRVSLDTMSMILFSIYNALTFIFLILSPGPTLFTGSVGQILWGSILAIKPGYLAILASLSLGYLMFLWIFWGRLSAILFDPRLSEAEGVNVRLYEYALLAVTGIIVVMALKITGGFLVFSLLYIPTAAALQLFNTLKKFLAASCLLGSASASLGLAFSLATNLPAGSCIVIVAVLIFLASTIISRVKARSTSGEV